MSSSAGEANLPYRYRFPRPAVTVDCLIYTLEEREPWILLIKRKNDPFKGSWALPGKEDREGRFEKASELYCTAIVEGEQIFEQSLLLHKGWVVSVEAS